MRLISQDLSGLILGLAICVATVLVLYILAARWAVPRSVFWLCLSVFAGHLVVGGVLVLSGQAQVGDAVGYESSARNIAGYLSGQETLSSVGATGKAGWSWLLGVSYWIASPHPLIGLSFNAAALSALPMIFWHLMEQLGKRRVAMSAAVLACLSPAWWLWGSLPLREAFNTLFICVFVAWLCLYVHQRRSSQLVVLLLAAIGVNFFRGSLAVILVVAAMLAIILSSGRRFTSGRAPSLLGIPVLVLLVVVGQGAYSGAAGTLTTDRAVQVRSSQSSNANTGFAVSETGADSTTTLGIQTVKAAPRVVLGPLPWEVGAYVFFLPDLVFWWYLLSLAFRGSKDPFSRSLLLPLGLIALGILAALAVYSGNYGTLIRLRAQVVPALIPLAAIGWSRRSRQTHGSARRESLHGQSKLAG